MSDKNTIDSLTRSIKRQEILLREKNKVISDLSIRVNDLNSDLCQCQSKVRRFELIHSRLQQDKDILIKQLAGCKEETPTVFD